MIYIMHVLKNGRPKNIQERTCLLNLFICDDYYLEFVLDIQNVYFKSNAGMA